ATQPVHPPGIELIVGRGFDGLGESRRLAALAAIDEQRHQRHARRLRAWPFRDGRAERRRGIVAAAEAEKHFSTYQLEQIPHLPIGRRLARAVEERERTLKIPAAPQ